MSTEKKETQGKHYVVDVRNISPLNRAGGNVRSDYGEKDGTLMELVNSIRKYGILEPFKGFRDPENTGKWIAVNGHTRMKACEILAKENIFPVAKMITIGVACDISDEDLLFHMYDSNTGRQLKPMEFAEICRRLKQVHGYIEQ